ncbi:MAG: ABC transporter ATP-binding protein, partial [Firmicutes bacterium]|nr:ABC transporter ATP-binding protein [Bacillota bacterium]
MIEVRDLFKVYGKDQNRITALGGVSFDLASRELTVILGPSGSGKSTVLNILGGMDTATSGSVKIAGKELTALKDKELTAYRRDDIGFIFQFYNLMPNLTALENVQLCERASGALTAARALGL